MSVLCASWGQADVCLKEKKFIRHRRCWWYMAHVQPWDVLTGSRKTLAWVILHTVHRHPTLEKRNVPDKLEEPQLHMYDVGGNATRWSGKTSPTERMTWGEVDPSGTADSGTINYINRSNQWNRSMHRLSIRVLVSAVQTRVNRRRGRHGTSEQCTVYSTMCTWISTLFCLAPLGWCRCCTALMLSATYLGGTSCKCRMLHEPLALLVGPLTARKPCLAVFKMIAVRQIGRYVLLVTIGHKQNAQFCSLTLKRKLLNGRIRVEN